MRCAIKWCKQREGMKYYDKPLCDKHFGRYTGEELKELLGITKTIKKPYWKYDEEYTRRAEVNKPN